MQGRKHYDDKMRLKRGNERGQGGKMKTLKKMRRKEKVNQMKNLSHNEPNHLLPSKANENVEASLENDKAKKYLNLSEIR